MYSVLEVLSDNLYRALNSLPELTDKIEIVYDEDQVYRFTGSVTKPCAVIQYLMRRPNQEKGTQAHGISIEMVFAVYLFAADNINSSVDTKEAYNIVDQVTNKIIRTKTPLLRPWTFLLESIADTPDGVAYIQRWGYKTNLVSFYDKASIDNFYLQQ